MTGESPVGFKSAIDRRSYAIETDLQAATGSIGDALRNIPSLSVDMQGNVSLRGDQNVTIMVDGKPTTLFRGPGAGQVLQSLPASQFERVEVIANPSAAMSPEGSGGIINLITAKAHTPGRATAVRANLGSSGRRNLSLTQSYSSKDLRVSADLALRHDPLGAAATDLRQIGEPTTGDAVVSRDDSDQAARLDLASLHLSVDYDLGRNFRISGDARHVENWFVSRIGDRFDQTGPSAADSVLFDRDGEVRLRRTNDAITGTVKRNIADSHSLLASLSYEETNEGRRRQYATSYAAPAGLTDFRNISLQTLQRRTRLTLDDKWELPDASRLSVGYEFQRDDNQFDNVGFRGTTSKLAGSDPGQTNLFLFKQTLNAAYATYEQTYGDWKFLAGVRLEEVRLDLRQFTLNMAGGRGYSGAYPSFHLEYALSGKQKLNFTVSRRIQRPNPQDYNPFESFDDQAKFLAGNPNLKPQKTWSYELGYQYKDGDTYYATTIYDRDNKDVVSDFATTIGSGAILLTKENLARSRTVGLELVANGRVSKRVTYSVSGNTYWGEVDALNFGLGRRSAVGFSSRASVNFSLTSKDLLQANLFVNGKQLTLQGSREAAGGVNLGYRHQFDSQLSAVVTVQDALASYRDRIIIDTPALKERSEVRPAVRAVFVGFTYMFGGAAKRSSDPGFDYGASGPR